MHIAFNGWFWDQPWTGSGQYIRNLVQHLYQLDPSLQLSIVLPSHIQMAEDVPEGVAVIHARAFQGGNWGKLWFEQRAFPAAMKELKPDIAHIPYWGTPLSTKPARLVTSVLDLIPLLFPAYRSGLLSALYTSLVSATADGSAHIITLSEASKADIVDHLEIDPERISVTYLAADDRFHPKMGAEHDASVREKYNLPHEFALYLGGFDVRKNVNNLLLAWTYAGPSFGEDIPLVLAGREPAEWGTKRFPDLKKYAAELDIERYLMWLGEISEEDKPSLYRLARAVVVPSMYEGFGLPILEAMASGTPVITSKRSSLAEVAGEAAYLVDPENARDMAGAIIAVMVQDDLYSHLSNQGRGRVTQFSWRKTAQDTLKVYQQVMQK